MGLSVNHSDHKKLSSAVDVNNHALLKAIGDAVSQKIASDHDISLTVSDKAYDRQRVSFVLTGSKVVANESELIELSDSVRLTFDKLRNVTNLLEILHNADS